MKQLDDIRDDEIRVLGSKPQSVENNGGRKRGKIIAIIAGVVIAAIVLLLLIPSGEPEADKSDSVDSYFEQDDAAEPEDISAAPEIAVRTADAPETPAVSAPGFTEIRDTVACGMPLRVYIPHNAEMSLQVGRISRNDSSIIYCAQAADIRADNLDIVGAFILNGEQLSRGSAKKGFCAIINGKITIGCAQATSLFEEASAAKGSFFRQFPLVYEGQPVENKLKNKSIRRALCDKNGKIFMVETTDRRQTLHDFSAALAGLGITNAIYLVGSSSYGWAVNENNERVEFGLESRYLPESVSYIVWKRK